ncbi:MAG: hypothetical protein IT306_11220 [Chloroflexi bacterium]|nr:hypothetical protein [Chloroflexota bacterium]
MTLGAYTVLGQATPARVGSMPPLPRGWPSTLQLGMSGGTNTAASMRATAPFGLRYQYLAGGVNTGAGWTNWMPNGEFVTAYMRESAAQGMLPVFTYYQITQSAPGRGSGTNEPNAVIQNVTTPETMRAYFDDLRLVLLRAGSLPNQTVVLHVEPDLWGFLHQRAQNDDPHTVRVIVGSSGLSLISDLPDDASGLAQAIVRLRDQAAPNVLLAYHVSAWGGGTDPFYQNSWDRTVDRLAQREATFYAGLGARFDLAFSETSDRDAAFKQAIYRDRGRSWWNDADFARHARFLSGFAERTRLRVVIWQIPYGNTKMRAVNNTWNHYQDNRVEWLLDDPGGAHLRQYAEAGVIGLLFGRGADGATDASDASGDGITEPPPIDGNVRPSLNADDDGGYFRERASAYYRVGAVPLP